MNLEPVRRYVPLLSWIVALAACLLIPLKIISYGFVPAGDARRHVARALVNKDLPEIVVVQPEYKMDHSEGWDWILRHVDRWFLGPLHRTIGENEDTLISFSVVSTMVCFFLAPMPWLRRPEAWLAALLAQVVAVPDLMVRITQGRPYLFSEAVLVCILFAWPGEGTQRPPWHKFVLTILGFVVSVAVHGAWYLWIVVLAAYFLAGAWRPGLWLTFCWGVGVVIGAALTGRPFEFLKGAVFMAASVYKEHAPAWMLVGEFQPSEGEFFTLSVLALVFVWRLFRKKETGGILRQPVFWMIFIGWTLGFKADRFWADWGMPAATVWLAMQFDEFLGEAWQSDAPRRLLVCAMIAAPLFMDSTSDLRNRYTYYSTESFVDGSEPDMKGWMPDDGGIFYAAEMQFFYNTFYRNPEGNWRYILGYEPALMPPADRKIFRDIQRSGYLWEAYVPWVRKMRPQDRVEIEGSVQPQIPGYPGMEWKLAAKDIWIGRLPRVK